MLAGCGGAQDFDLGHPQPEREPLIPIVLDQEVRGDTHDDDGWHVAGCTGGGVAGRHSAQAYRFVAPETGSYRVEIEAGYSAVVEVQDVDHEHPERVACFGAGAGRRGGYVVPMRRGGRYHLIVDGTMQTRGSYRLLIRRDPSPDGPIRAEDPALVGPACEAASVLLVGGEAAGTFRSTPGGLRASCGGTGGLIAYRIAVPPGGASIELAAHFSPILEVRSGCDGETVACAAAPPGAFEVALESPLPEGDYLVVVDTGEIVPRRPDGLEGAGVLGAYWLRATETTP